MAQSHRSGRGNGFGFFLIALGVLFLLDQYNVIYFDRVVENWWPLILIYIGLAKFKRKEQPGGMIILGIGIVFILSNMGYLYWGDVARLWPMILIIIGISIAFGGGRRFLLQEVAEDEFEARTIFGGLERHVTSQNLHGGEVMIIFGGAEVDLRDAKPAADCYIRVSVLFGGAEITVPSDWQVEISGTPILGGVDDKTNHSGGGPVVRIHCSALFGGIEISN